MDASASMMSASDHSGRASSSGNEFKFKYCRLCGVELTCGVFIYGEEGRGLHLADKIRKTLSILILEEDALPKKICTDCCTNLEEYSTFKDAVADAQAKLKAIAHAIKPVNHSSLRSTSQRGDETGSASSGRVLNGNCSNSSGATKLIRDGISSLATRVSTFGQISSSLSSPLARCTTCGASFASRAALDGHIIAEHASSRENPPTPNEQNEPVELHIPSPSPSEDPVLVEEDGNVKSSTASAHISQEVAVSDSDASPTSQHSPSKFAPCSSASVSTSATSPGAVSTSGKEGRRKRGKEGGGYHCAECNKTFASQAGYYHHMTIVHKGRRFQCSLCENIYCSKASLQYHEQSFHAATSTVQSPTASSSTTIQLVEFQCPECPKSFRTKKRWTEHKKTHTTIRSFECTVCHKFFKTSKCLRNHMGYHDSSTKTHPCPICTKQFTKKKYLEVHKKLHMSDKKIGCPFCPHVFNGYPNYVKHVRRKHSEKIGADGKMPKILKASKGTELSSENSEPRQIKGQRVDSPEPCSRGQTTKSCTAAGNQKASDIEPPAQPTSSVSSSSLYTSTVPANELVVHSQHVQNQNNVWSDPNKASHINQTQADRVHLTQNQQYSMNIMQQAQGQNSIPMIPMDDMVDSVIQTALLSHHHLESSSQHQGHSHASSMQPFNGQQNHRAQNNLSIVSINHPQIHPSNYQVLQQNEVKGNYVRQFDETPLELCVRNNGDNSAGDNHPDKGSNYNQLVDLTSAKIVDLSGVGLVMAAAASASNNSQSSTSTATNSMLYRQSNHQTQQQISTMSMLPIDLTDQQQQVPASGMESSGHMHMPLSLTASQSSNHNTSALINNNLVDLSYTGSNRGTSQFQMQQHQQSQQQQDDQMMSTSTFLRELLDLSCSTSTTRSMPSASASSIDTYPQQQQHVQHQNQFQPQHTFQHQQQSQYQQSSQDQTNQIQQYELNLSSKSRGYGMGQYHGQSVTNSNHGHTQQQGQQQQQQNMYQQAQTISHNHNNGNSNPGRNSTANTSGSSNTTTNQFHNIMYNDTLFM